MAAGGGLDAVEVASVARELDSALRSSIVRDCGVVAPFADLFLVLEGARGHEVLLVAATGPGRSRVSVTTARIGRSRMESGQRVEALRGALIGASIAAVTAVAGDRRLAVELAGPAGRTRVVAELFGRAGNWFVVDARGKIVALGHQVHGKTRTLEPGGAYEPPRMVPGATGTSPAAESADRFAPVAADVTPLARSQRIDRFFSEVDRGLVLGEELARVRERLRAAERQARDRVQGLATRAAEAQGADAIRQDADLLLANLTRLRRGMTEVTLSNWFADGNPDRTIPLVGKLDGRQNAEALYDRARRLADSVEVTARMLAEAQDRLRSIAALEESLGRVQSLDDLEALVPAIETLGLRGKQRAVSGGLDPSGRPRQGKGRAKSGAAPADAFRTFLSLEGYQILVGKSAAGNDAVTKRMARGNDIWLHIGGGIAGSHVVVRLPREKTASLETMLDAAHLAVHFSKARGRPACEVVYTQRKHVRKPKGFATGQVSLDRSKTIYVRADAERLKRVLDTAPGSGEELALPGGGG